MEYAIHQLADLAGVSTRTLRWYHKLGLLTPCRTAENGYRYYGAGEVDRLQQILFYRALGVELAQVKELLDDPAFDRLEALRGHLCALQQEEAHIQGLIKTVKETIFTAERKEIMKDSAKFEAFKRHAVEKNEAEYGKEIREKYGDEAVDKSNRQLLGMSQEDYSRMDAVNQELLSGLAQAVKAGESPQGPEGKRLALLHKQWLVLNQGQGSYSPQMHRGLAVMYTQDERFTAYYDREQPGCANFLAEAVEHWISEN